MKLQSDISQEFFTEWGPSHLRISTKLCFDHVFNFCIIMQPSPSLPYYALRPICPSGLISVFTSLPVKVIKCIHQVCSASAVSAVVWRFCTECKSKVLRAYGILVDDPDISGITAKLDRSSAGGQCRALFREVKACSTKRHIHVPCDEKYLKDVIERAEPELCGK